ncbi:BTB/POZ domain-containing protein 2-like [Phlebotomus papatasi]|uniref:BTB/POZ domain-containing protein 2-like n=1 Tax=Phlebotomus papatasi TaxID=29031 RepID=UPI002483E692|nr:BTB/POZ domain-containing protein 2-like [Phlebotomus papatasi]
MALRKALSQNLANVTSNNNLNSNRKEFGTQPNIIFIFPNNEGSILKAEKHELVKISEVFEKQFSSGFSDGNKNEQIAIADITFDTFNSMLNFIYNGHIDIYEGNYLEVLYAAKKYFIFELIHKVMDFILGFMNRDNLTDHYEFIENFGLKAVNEKMWEICVENPLIVIKNLNDSKPHKRILKMILKSPYLACSEYELYRAIMQMMTKKCKSEKKFSEKIRQELGNLIYFIRFPVMSVDELISSAKPPCPLKEKEIVDFLLWSKEKIFTETLLHFSTSKRISPPVHNSSHNSRISQPAPSQHPVRNRY